MIDPIQVLERLACEGASGAHIHHPALAELSSEARALILSGDATGLSALLHGRATMACMVSLPDNDSPLPDDAPAQPDDEPEQDAPRIGRAA